MLFFSPPRLDASRQRSRGVRVFTAAGQGYEVLPRGSRGLRGGPVTGPVGARLDPRGFMGGAEGLAPGWGFVKAGVAGRGQPCRVALWEPTSLHPPLGPNEATAWGQNKAQKP